MAAARRLWTTRRGVVLAVAVGAALRLAWVLWVTREPSRLNSDTGQFLAMARQFADGDTYRLNGHLSAFFASGWPLLLAPLAWLSDATGWFSLPLAASLVNVVAGTATIALSAWLADRWFGRTEATVTAWVAALALGPIFLTSAALNETVYTAAVLLVLVVVTRVLRAPPPPRTATMVGLGALLAWILLVRAPGALLLPVIVAALRVACGSWGSARRPVVLLLGTFVLVLVPFTVRNGVQVGVWTPASTNNAAFLCQGHRDGAIADATRLTDEDFRPCFTGTPFAPDPDESAWYGRTVREAVGWALTHPGEELRLTWDKTFELLENDDQALGDGQDFGRQEVVDEDLARRLRDLNDRRHLAVLGLGVVGFALLARGRAAWPLWVTAAGLLAVVWGGVVVDRFHHTSMAILVVAASATLTAVGRWASAGIRDRDDEREEQAADEPPPAPAEGLARASRPHTRLAGPNHHPFAPILVGLAAGAWTASLGFDLYSRVSDTEFVYARGAWLLTALGLVAALVGSFAVLHDLLGIPRRTRAFAVGVRRLIAFDVALVLFTASFLIRNASDFLFHDPSPTVATAFSLLGLVATGVSLWLDGILTYGYGVRVATDEERLAGFESPD